MRHLLLLVLGTSGLATLMLAGCQPKVQVVRPADRANVPAKSEPKPLRVLIVDDAALAKVARREWLARSETDFTLQASSLDDFRRAVADRALPNTDVLIYPPEMLGTLAETDAISPLPDFVSRGQFAQNDYTADDLLPTIREISVRWGPQTFAVPFGQPVFVLGYRQDVLDAIGVEPPTTWSELSLLVDKFTDFKPGDALAARWPSIALAQPLADGWAGQTLLARAAAYAKNRSRYSVLFDLRTMEASISSPAFVRALDELIADMRADDASLRWNPREAMGSLADGRSAVAIGWPGKRDGDHVAYDLRFVELPGATATYRISDQQWQPSSTVRRVTFLSSAGRLGSVIKSSRRQRAAWSLLVRLSGREWGLTVSGASSQTAMFRVSQLAAANRWIGDAWGNDAIHDYGSTVAATLSNLEAFSVPRIMRQDEYLAILETAVRRAISGAVTSGASLAAVADAWNELTEEIGRPTQSRAYHHELGIEP